MAARTIFLLRHGETVRHGDRRMLGQENVALSERGIEQARRWALRLTRCRIAALHCSDLIRSIDTAEIIAKSLNVAVEVWPQLREIDLGAWDGLTKEEVLTRYAAQWRRRGEDFENFRPPGGESFGDLRDRAIPSFQRILSSSDRSLLIAGHAGVNRVILCHLLGIPLNRLFCIAQDFAAMSLIEECEGRMQIAALNCRRLPDGNRSPYSLL